MSRESVKFVNAALDEDDKGNIILRGVLSPESFGLLKVDDYQREVLPSSKVSDLVAAFENSAVPDIDLGMRGGSYLEKDGFFYLQDDTYIIDGLQRVNAAKKRLIEGKQSRLGATVHFNTDRSWELNRFRILNTTNVKLSPSVIIRNFRDEYSVVEMLYNLTKDKSFIISNKVSWNQRMKRGELVTAKILLTSTAFLHSKYGPTRSLRYLEVIKTLQQVNNKLGRNTLRGNTKVFWDTIDECYNIRNVTFREQAAYLKSGFLYVMATFFSDHANFWKDSSLFVDAKMKRKLATFPIQDPEIRRLASMSVGTSKDMLYNMIVKHFNSGKRVNKLQPSKRNVKDSIILESRNDIESE